MLQIPPNPLPPCTDHKRHTRGCRHVDRRGGGGCNLQSDTACAQFTPGFPSASRAPLVPRKKAGENEGERTAACVTRRIKTGCHVVVRLDTEPVAHPGISNMHFNYGGLYLTILDNWFFPFRQESSDTASNIN